MKNEIYFRESIRIAKRIDALNKKPIFLFKESDLVFVNESLTQSFGPALVEKCFGINEVASRWMMVFENCLRYMSSQESHESRFELFL